MISQCNQCGEYLNGGMLKEHYLVCSKKREVFPLSADMEDNFDHPCKETCSGWKQGYEVGKLERLSTPLLGGVEEMAKKIHLAVLQEHGEAMAGMAEHLYRSGHGARQDEVNSLEKKCDYYHGLAVKAAFITEPILNRTDEMVTVIKSKLTDANARIEKLRSSLVRCADGCQSEKKRTTGLHYARVMECAKAALEQDDKKSRK